MRAGTWVAGMALALVLGVGGLSLLGGQLYLGVKARLAAVLIDRAWRAHLRDGRSHRPWAWADMHPIARLEFPRIGVSRVVLSGASGSSLAFGLGHVSGTASPGSDGNCVVAGHRDTWASFMRHLRTGDEVWLESPSGRRRYTVARIEVLSMHRVDVLEPTAAGRLTLITCYPFSGLLRGEWRFVATCVPDAGTRPDGKKKSAGPGPRAPEPVGGGRFPCGVFTRSLPSRRRCSTPPADSAVSPPPHRAR